MGQLAAGQTGAGQTSGANAAGLRVDVSGGTCALAPYATLRAAEELVHAGRGDDALARARMLGDDFAAYDAARLAMADANVLRGDRASAVPLWHAALAAAPHGARWADTSLQLAGALLDGIVGPAADHATEALDLATRVLVDAPFVAEKADVAGLRARAAAAAGLSGAPSLTFDERARQAQAWYDAQQPKRAMEVVEALLRAVPRADTKHRAAGCHAAILRAQALPRALPHTKAPASADAWGAAIDRCDGDDALVTALYYGARASASAHRPDEAVDRYARVEKLFPSNRLADDARLRAAQVVLDQGDSAKAVAMLASLPDAYPDGDMRGEALFRAALQKLAVRDLDGARALLDRLLAMAPSPDERAVAGSAGRAAYYRARVAQLTGDVADAKARYALVIGAHPMSFYMLLAFERLRDLDPAAARAALADGPPKEARAPFLTMAHPELESPAFDRFQRLLEVGEFDAARREAAAGGLTGEAVDAEVLWAVAWSYDRAGAPDIGHSFARGRLSDFREHWPAGRWRLPWQVAYPRPWADVVAAESSAAGIPAPLTWAIMREESAFNPDAKSAASAYGLMQLLVGTGRQVARGVSIPAVPSVIDEAALQRPEVSIALGARMLGSMRASFSGNPSLAIAAYNCGASPVRRWLAERAGDDFDVWVERIPFDETRNYLKRVLTSEAAYASLYAPTTLDELTAIPESMSQLPRAVQAAAGP